MIKLILRANLTVPATPEQDNSFMPHFEGFDLDLESGNLSRNGVRVKLQPQPMRILCLLVSRAGHLVTREEIQKHIWADQTFVDFEHGLNYSIRAIRSALGDDAETPRYIETEPRRGYRFIAVVTSSDAPQASPFPSNGTGAAPIPPSLPASAALRPRLMQRMAGLLTQHRLITVFVLPAGLISYPAWRYFSHELPKSMGRPAPAPDAAVSRRTIAVLGFRNLSRRPEEAWLSTALSEMLSTELAAGKTFRIIPEENIARMKIDLALGDVNSYSPETLAMIRSHSGTEMVVSGSYLLIQERGSRHLRVDFRLQDTITSETIESNSQLGTQEGLFSLISQAGAQLSSKLGSQELSSAVDTRVPHAPGRGNVRPAQLRSRPAPRRSADCLRRWAGRAAHRRFPAKTSGSDLRRPAHRLPGSVGPWIPGRLYKGRRLRRAGGTKRKEARRHAVGRAIASPGMLGLDGDRSVGKSPGAVPGGHGDILASRRPGRRGLRRGQSGRGARQPG